MRPTAPLSAILGIFLLAAATPLGLASTISGGTLYPLGDFWAEGGLAIPVSQPFVVTWTSVGHQLPVLNASRVTYYVDEWRWTSAQPATADTPVPAPGTAVHTHSEQSMEAARVAVLGLGASNEFTVSSKINGASVTGTGFRDCKIHPGLPSGVIPHAANTQRAAHVEFNGRVPTGLPAATILHVECGQGTLGFTLPAAGDHILTIFDARLRLVGFDVATGQPQDLLVEPGVKSTRNQSAPLYDNVVRHVSLRSVANPMESTGLFVSQGERVRFQTPLLQTSGMLVLPPFVGVFQAGTTTHENKTTSTHMEGTFLLMPNGRYRELNGVEVAGSSLDVAAGGYRRPDVHVSLATMVAVAAAAGLMALLVKLAWSRKGFLLLAPFFTRLTRAKALEHETRQAIFQYVQSNPGVRLHVACAALGIPRATLVHHVRILREQGLVHVQKLGQRACLFAVAPARNEAAILILSRDDVVKRILEMLSEGGVVSQQEIADRVQVSQSYASRLLRKLEACGAIVRHRTARGSRYRLTV